MLVSNCVFNLITIGTILASLVYQYLKWKVNFWQRNGISTIRPYSSPIFGDCKEIMTGNLSLATQFKQFYDIFKSRGCQYGGIYFGPRRIFLPVDTGFIKDILQKDFVHFINHGLYFNEKNDPLSGHLFNLENAKWRKMRVKLTPTFTSQKMKMMFQTLADCTVGLNDILMDAHLKKEPIEIKDVLTRFTTDVIGSTAFGIDCNSLKNPDTEFRKYGKKVFYFGIMDLLKILLTLCCPHALLHFFGMKIIRRDVNQFFKGVMDNTVKYREENNIYRKDFMHLLLQLKNRGEVCDDGKIFDKEDVKLQDLLKINELYALAFGFFIAGYETSSTLMTWTLYELAINDDIQRKLRHEIDSVLAKYNYKLSYEAISEMTYLDQVLFEALRKYPPLPLLLRMCTKDYKVLGSDYIMKKGEFVVISSLGIQNDPEFYPDPGKFDPDRFTEENKQKRPPFTWIPFGEGPRLCIGLRFGLMQSKVGLATLLKDFKVSLNSKTKSPIQMSTTEFIMAAEGGIWLDIQKVKTT